VGDAVVKTSTTTSEIATALAAMELMLENPTKTTKGGGGQKVYKYAPLPEILDVVRPLMHGHGLFLTMDTLTEDGRAGVVARLLHVSGEFIEYGPLMLPAGNDAQSAGSAITYARRYLLCAALGIAADEDDDGAKAKDSWGSAVKRPAEEYGEGSSAGEPSGVEEPLERGGPPVPPPDEPHDHVKGKQLASGSWLCSFEKPDGTVCGEKFKPAPTVFTEPVQERADIK
jgi:hypothetical protein